MTKPQLNARLEMLAADNNALRQELAERDQAAVVREAALVEALAQARAEAALREEAAQRREEELKAVLGRLEAALSRQPWWSRWWFRKGK